MRNQYRGRTAKIVKNGHAYYATFEYRDVSKNIEPSSPEDSLESGRIKVPNGSKLSVRNQGEKVNRNISERMQSQ